jgi:membrane-bound inhibitor of C-type lysozyme
MTFKRLIFYIVIVALIGIIGYSFIHSGPKLNAPLPTPPAVIPVVTSTENYSCDGGTTIVAAYSSQAVQLTLSDGRTLNLPQTTSADGARYEQGNIAFVTSGDQAYLQENNATTYNNCIVNNGNTVSNGMKSFTDQGKTFTFEYPAAFMVSGGGIGYTESWKTDSDSTLGLILATINVPQGYEPNTNFGDATFTVGTSSDPAAVKSCLADTTGDNPTSTTATINGVNYTKITTEDAGAGQRYLTTSYRTVQNNQCYAIEYTIHYADLENYGPGSGVTAFDQQKITSALDSIVQSFKFLPQ